MESMSTFNKVLFGAFGVFAGALLVAAASRHRDELTSWTSRQGKKLLGAVIRYRKERQIKRAQRVASEI